MHGLLKRYIRHNIPVSEEALDMIANCFKPLAVKKNTILLSKGEVSDKLYFVNNGCIRAFYINKQGNETTRLIATEGMIAGSLNSFISNQPSFEFVGTLEDCGLLFITRARFYKLAAEVPEWEKFYLKLLEFAYSYQNKKIEELVTLSAGERYAVLMKENPGYIQRLSNKILASYLGIREETLSRLKSK